VEEPNQATTMTFACTIPKTEAAIQAVGQLLGIPHQDRHGNRHHRGSKSESVYADHGFVSTLADSGLPAFKSEERHRLRLVPANPNRKKAQTDAETCPLVGVCPIDPLVVYGSTPPPNPPPPGEASWNYGSGGAGGPGTSGSPDVPPVSPTLTPGFNGDTLPKGPEPDCTKAQTVGGYIAWCASHHLTAVELQIIQNALARLDQRGPECHQLADFGRSLLPNRVRVYPYMAGIDSGYGASGYGIAIQDTYVYKYAPAPSYETPPRNLDMALAHELYHEMHPEYDHGVGKFNPYDQQCSGLP
jgi:hypothetical protein